MRTLLLGLLVLLALIMIMAVAAWTLWGVWGLLGAFVVLIAVVLVLKKLAGRLVMMAFSVPFKMKGKVLRGAAVTVHSVTPAERPDRSLEHEDEEPDSEMFDSPEEAEEYRREMAEQRRQRADADSRRRWYLLDMTITPQEACGEGFTYWEPGELAIVSPESRPPHTFGSGDEPEEIGEVCDVSLWNPEREEFCDDDAGKYRGPLRLQIRVGVDPGHDHLAFRYYFEQFGDVNLVPN